MTVCVCLQGKPGIPGSNGERGPHGEPVSMLSSDCCIDVVASGNDCGRRYPPNHYRSQRFHDKRSCRGRNYLINTSEAPMRLATRNSLRGRRRSYLDLPLFVAPLSLRSSHLKVPPFLDSSSSSWFSWKSADPSGTCMTQIFIRLGGFINAGDTVYVMGLILPLAGLQFNSRHSQLSLLCRLKHWTVCFAIIC